MKTIQSNIKKAKKYLDNDDCIAVPTETVYGLAGNAYSNKAVKKIFKLKKRPSNNPLIIHYYNMNELKNIHGVGEGKARKYGSPFLTLIQDYVNENDITRPDDLIVKSTGANSGLKLYMIQNVDRKLPLDDIASAKGMNMSNFISEMETIVYAGTKLDISYWIDEILDEDQQEELHEYFMEAESDDIKHALEEFDGDIEEEDIRLFRIKFINDVAN